MNRRLARRLSFALVLLGLLTFETVGRAETCDWVVVGFYWDDNTQNWEPIWEYLCWEDPPQPPEDSDGDGIPDGADNCPGAENPDQADGDGNGVGDACDAPPSPDSDGDGVPDASDNCPSVWNPDQADGNGNGIGDACEFIVPVDPDSDGDGVSDVWDNCPGTWNPDQADSDLNGIGDACDVPVTDSDGDGVPDPWDNCVSTFNPDQSDSDGNGFGDACQQNLQGMTQSVFGDLWESGTFISGYVDLIDVGTCVGEVDSIETTVLSPSGRSATASGESASLSFDDEEGDWSVLGDFTVYCTCGDHLMNILGGASELFQAQSCTVPSGETTQSGGWQPGAPAVHNWWQTLIGGNFARRYVVEEDPGGGGPDTCWFPGSQYSAGTSVSGGSWGVTNNNLWGPDQVGWHPPDMVHYYRSQGQTPCGTQFPQRMVINCSNGPPRAYTTTTLRTGITNTTVWSERSGLSVSKIGP